MATLMLNAPVVRRVRGFRKSRQLRLESDRPINILVVDANVADFDRIGGPDDRTLQDFLLHYRFDSLSNTAKERGYFEDLRGRLDHDSRLRQSIGEIRVLPNDGTGGACLADAIRHELSGERAIPTTLSISRAIPSLFRTASVAKVGGS